MDTIKVPFDTIVRWMSTLQRGRVHEEVSAYGPILVERDGRVLVKVDNHWRKAVSL